MLCSMVGYHPMASKSGFRMNKDRFLCELIRLYVFSEGDIFINFLFFLQITLGAFQRTYSELLAHFEPGDNGVRSG